MSTRPNDQSHSLQNKKTKCDVPPLMGLQIRPKAVLSDESFVTIPSGTVLYTGQASRPQPSSSTMVYATPSRNYAETYARIEEGLVYTLVVQKELRLVKKKKARSAANSRDCGEKWERFGESFYDNSVARNLCNKMSYPSHPLHGRVDGWVHKYDSEYFCEYFSEVMLCNLHKVTVEGEGVPPSPQPKSS